jgi:Cellulase (glycosyl hydrolase family 5)
MTSLRGSFRLSPTLVSTVLMALLVALSAGAADRSGFKAKRGTNISHWLSQSTNRGVERRTWFTKEDVAFLAGLGFDHLRIPIDEEQMWDQSGKPEIEAFSLLNQALDWCAEYKLNAIVDLHILRSHHFNEKARRDCHYPGMAFLQAKLLGHFLSRLDPISVVIPQFR